MRLKLKAKTNKPLNSIFETLSELKERNNFECIDKNELLFINPYIYKKYNIDLNDLFKSIQEENINFIDADIKLRTMLLTLFCESIDFDFVISDSLINYFNSKENKKFTKTKVNKNKATKKYLKCVILFTYYKNYICKDISKLKIAIDRLDKHGLESQKFKFLKKWDILDFFLDAKDSGYISGFLEEDHWVFKNSLFNRKSKYEPAQAKWKSIFISSYENKDRGELDYKKHKSKLVLFLDWLIDCLMHDQRSLCGFKLTVPVKRNGSTISEMPVLQEYLLYIRQTLGRGLLVKDIVEIVNWHNFVNHRMRGEYGYEKFWKRLDNVG